jgi:hypothetical protein
MPAALVLGNDNLAQAEIKARAVTALLTIKTSGTAGSITITSDNPGVLPTWAGGPTLPDTGTSFPSLTFTSNSIIGLLVVDGGLQTVGQPYRGGTFGFKTAFSGGVASLTAVTDTPCGVSSSGVTASKNGAVALTLTGITLNATATTQYLLCELEFFQA